MCLQSKLGRSSYLRLKRVIRYHRLRSLWYIRCCFFATGSSCSSDLMRYCYQFHSLTTTMSAFQAIRRQRILLCLVLGTLLVFSSAFASQLHIDRSFSAIPYKRTSNLLVSASGHRWGTSTASRLFRLYGSNGYSSSQTSRPLGNLILDELLRKLGLTRNQTARWMDNCLSRLLSFVYLLYDELRHLSPVQKSLFASTFLIGLFLGSRTPFWRRFTNLNDIPSRRFGPRAKPLVGRAVRISDGDTIRFLHTPTPWHPKALRKRQKASVFALPIRLCTMDTPELAKFGQPGQPFGPEAKAMTASLLPPHRRVYIRLLSRDQYGRAVAQVYTKGRWLFWVRRHVDAALLQAGLAEVYTGAGAVYGPKGLAKYRAMEQAARERKVGMWSLGKERESAADYKKKNKK